MPTIFLTKNGSKKKIKVEKNISLLEIAFNENLDIEGSCGGEMACSTCHILIDPKWHSKLLPPCVNEKEMLELLPDFSKYSRLGCQIVITKNLDGLHFSIPKEN